MTEPHFGGVPAKEPPLDPQPLAKAMALSMVSGSGKTTTKTAPKTSEDPFATEEPLVETARKALRERLEGELRAIPFEERVAAVMAICADANGKCDLGVHCRYVMLPDKPGVPQLRYRLLGPVQPDGDVNLNEHATLGEAFVQIGADALEALEKQAASLQLAATEVEKKIAKVRGPR